MRRPLSILLVEDSEEDETLLLRELRTSGYDVEHERVQTQAEMRQALTARGWELVICDYSLPSFDGLRALEIVRELKPDTPCIIISGLIGEESAVAALHAGAYDFVVKGKYHRLAPAIERARNEGAARLAQRQAERALRESEERYRLIVETTNEGVLTVDRASVTTFVNGRMSELLGYEASTLLARTIFDFVHPESKEALARALEAPPQPGTGETEIRFIRANGKDLWVLLDATLTRDAAGTPDGALVMAMDVTQRKRLEEQLRQAQKMEAIGSLAGGVAHDFNNLLSVILSYTDLILKDLLPGDPIRADIHEISKAGERARELTRQLLAFSRRQVLDLRTLDLSRIVAGMEHMLRRLVGEDIQLSLLTQRSLAKVRADGGQIEQILMNLVVNARDAMPDGGTVTIETANTALDAEYAAAHHGVVPGPYVLLAVTDTGVGMDATTRERIFEPFFTTKEKGKGTGLGLSTVFGIVKQMGGHIWVYSEPSKGTTFKVYLPQTEGSEEEALPTDPPVTLRGSETILLVEDDEQLRKTLQLVLRRQGYNVLEAQNGGEALLICEKYTARIDLLLTDVVMPRMSGRELAQRLTPLRPEMKVLYLSGYTENTVVHHGILDAGVAFFQKPVTPDAIARKIREVLSSSR